MIWYKDVAAALSAGGVNNAFDYTELSEKIPEIEPKDRQTVLAFSEEQINSMTTVELLVICLDYPLFGDIYFYDNAVIGLERVVGHFNGLQALLARDDIGDAVYSFYSEIDLEKIMDTDDFGSLRFDYLTLLISDDRVLENMTSELRQRSCWRVMQFVKKLKFNIFCEDMRLAKNPFCRANVPLAVHCSAAAGGFSLNFAKFRGNSPHVPLCRKSPQGFFDNLNHPSAIMLAGDFFTPLDNYSPFGFTPRQFRRRCNA